MISLFYFYHDFLENPATLRRGLRSDFVVVVLVVLVDFQELLSKK